MAKIIKAIRFQNLDKAAQALEKTVSKEAASILQDGGREPEGLLSAIPEDRLEEEDFYRLFDLKEGVLIEVERISYSGYGPPADPQYYMGFVTEKTAYVVRGRVLAIDIESCPAGAMDIHHLEAMVLDHQHPVSRPYVAENLGLQPDWDFDDLFELVSQGRYTAEQIDRIFHQGIQ